VITWVVLLSITTLIAAQTNSFVDNVIDLRLRFSQWKLKHQKSYISQMEHDHRFSIFSHNVRTVIDPHNQAFSRGEKTWDMEANKFADMTFEEFKEFYKMKDGFGLEQDCSATLSPKQSQFKKQMRIPKSKDWRKDGVVTPVKNQLNCGSCWTFSSTGAAESHYALKHNKLLSLSEQQLVDCAGLYDNFGCDGGLPSHAFEYIRYLGERGGWELEETYPYKAVDQKCQYNATRGIVRTYGSYNITEGDEDELVASTYFVGPVSVAYQVVEDFRFYKSGVYQSTNCKSGPKDVNHAVLVVGFDSTPDGIPYYIIKNSWSSDWGMSGYFYMIRNRNECGVATCSSFPLIK